RDINLEEITIIIFALIDGLIARQAINTTFSFKDDLPMFFDVMAKLLK
ncbi:TetR family transcriptional regulator, partial [Klebsiella pneumoniae]